MKIPIRKQTVSLPCTTKKVSSTCQVRRHPHYKSLGKRTGFESRSLMGP
jgi:hypothetical protein